MFHLTRKVIESLGSMHRIAQHIEWHLVDTELFLAM